jgi:hypothetical protein
LVAPWGLRAILNSIRFSAILRSRPAGLMDEKSGKFHPPIRRVVGSWVHHATMHHFSGGYRRPRTRDPLVLIAVRYASGSSAYIRVTPEEALSPLLRKIAHDRQASGEIPEGEIAGVTKVR